MGELCIDPVKYSIYTAIFQYNCPALSTRKISEFPMSGVTSQPIPSNFQRPVCLFSMDTDNFNSPPTTTAGLTAYYQQYSQSPQHSKIELTHFLMEDDLEQWKQNWLQQTLPAFLKSVENNLTPIAGFSFYTWNAAQFLDLCRFIKSHCPQACIIAGGPHVQQAEDYLFDEAIDIVVLGEGERTFCELLDAFNDAHSTGALQPLWQQVKGIAYLDPERELVKTPAQERIKDLDSIPSPLNVLTLCDEAGNPFYETICYETSRGCPFKCAFCEWGTGAIGTKMLPYSMERIQKDWEVIIQSGIKDIWLADSNFGALKNDLQKAELLVDLKQRYGRPSTFATSWAKNHSKQVQQIVRLLNQHDLLPHYQLALQTLTSEALQLSHRENMKANQYEPIAKQMASEGVPIIAELIWGLPGDNLKDFELNLNKLLGVFPGINIFGYTLLPGTEFYERREEYQIKTIPVAGYGKAHGEYVVGCHSFSEEEGKEGYFLIAAHLIFVPGHLLPLFTKHLTLLGVEKTAYTLGEALRKILDSLIEHFLPFLPDTNWQDRMTVYENRDALYLTLLEHREACFNHIRQALPDILPECPPHLLDQLIKTILVDEKFCPRTGPKHTTDIEFSFDAESIKQSLENMELPEEKAFSHSAQQTFSVFHCGGAGEVLKSPDGGHWMKGKIVS